MAYIQLYSNCNQTIPPLLRPTQGNPVCSLIQAGSAGRVSQELRWEYWLQVEIQGSSQMRMAFTIFEAYLNYFQMKRHPEDDPIGHLTNPIVTGGAIIALRCREGVVIATDTLLSYGGLLKYHGVNRYEKIADNVIVTATGEFADFQEATRKLKELTHESAIFDDGVTHSVEEYSSYLAAMAYDRRNNQNPYYNNFVIAGYENGKAYLSSIDLYGSHIHKDYITAGFSKYYGLAIIANNWNPDKTLEECKKIIHRCFTIIYERDCHSVDEVQFATVTERGVQVLPPEKVQSDWDFREFRERKNEKLWQ